MKRADNGCWAIPSGHVERGESVEEAIVREVREEGFQLSSTPGSVHTFKSIVIPGIARAGLVSDRVRPGYEEAQIKVFTDSALLRELEDRGDVA